MLSKTFLFAGLLSSLVLADNYQPPDSAVVVHLSSVANYPTLASTASPSATSTYSLDQTAYLKDCDVNATFDSGIQYGARIIDPSFVNNEAKLAPIDNPNRGLNLGKNMSVLFTNFTNKRMVYYTQPSASFNATPDSFITMDYTAYASFVLRRFIFGCFKATTFGGLGDMVPCTVYAVPFYWEETEQETVVGEYQSFNFTGSGEAGTEPAFAESLPESWNKTVILWSFATDFAKNVTLKEDELLVTAFDNFEYTLQGGIRCPYPVLPQYSG